MSNPERLYRQARCIAVACIAAFSLTCGGGDKADDRPASVTTSAAVRLNFKFEADVPAPVLDARRTNPSERNSAVQADFDNGRQFELLDRTIQSPNGRHILAVYHHISDVQNEYRLDMYSGDGKLLRKVTSDTMAVHFPDTIVWSPDSSNVAFVATTRAVQSGVTVPPTGAPPPANTQAAPGEQDPAAANAATPEPKVQTVPTPIPPTGILTFRTEQIYIASAEGTSVRPLTENEGLIYFYYTWSPDSTMLAAMAATSREWRYDEIIAGGKGEQMVPKGRLRIIEKNGRERRLDDNITGVRPVWSPDSTKVASAYDTQVRIYDAVGLSPTQAAIPLRNQLLISSAAHDRALQRLLQESGAVDANASPSPTPAEQPLSALPDEKQLVSYNPIVEVAWPSNETLYLETAFVRLMQNPAENVRSYSRWHRLLLTAQPEITPTPR